METVFSMSEHRILLQVSSMRFTSLDICYIAAKYNVKSGSSTWGRNVLKIWTSTDYHSSFTDPLEFVKCIKLGQLFYLPKKQSIFHSNGTIKLLEVLAFFKYMSSHLLGNSGAPNQEHYRISRKSIHEAISSNFHKNENGAPPVSDPSIVTYVSQI